MLQRVTFLPLHEPVARVVKNPLPSILGVSTDEFHIHLTFLKRVEDHGAEMRACAVRLSWRAERQRLCRRGTEEHLHNGAQNLDLKSEQEDKPGWQIY